MATLTEATKEYIHIPVEKDLLETIMFKGQPVLIRIVPSFGRRMPLPSVSIMGYTRAEYVKQEGFFAGMRASMHVPLPFEEHEEFRYEVRQKKGFTDFYDYFW
ncbi:hypothetical protein HYV81_05805 [Candidatus Woesearchaeota archaeon]|nr:hypothetical protein [Candidatus Woesearchaeota archaeon]